MASLNNVNKNFQRLHRERHQPERRRHLGYLEKKKDYKQRADDFQRKHNTLKKLRRKALDKNPDEFYFHFTNSHLVDGKHYEKANVEEFTPQQLKLMLSKDISYVNYKRTIELKKIERLRASLHLIGVEKPKNKHVFFVDTKEEASSSNLAQKLNTLPELIESVGAFNVPRLDNLATKRIKFNEQDLDAMDKERDRMYNELKKRVAREKQLTIIWEKMSLKDNLMRDKNIKKKKEEDGSASTESSYKWVKERKK